MTAARTVAIASFIVLALAPSTALADGISLTKYTVVPSTIYPSATNGSATSTTITLGFSQRVKASLVIKDAGGTSVRALYSSSGVTTPTPKIWDGKDDHGALVAPGAYTIDISASTSTLSFDDSSQVVTVAAPITLAPPAITTQNYSLPIASGWNLLSMPVAPSDARAASIFSATSTDAVWSYDPANPSADASGWLVYDPAHPELSSLATVAPGEGYFVHASSTGSIAVSGALFAPGTVPPARALPSGWSLVGSYATSSEDIDSAFATIGWAGLEYTSLWKLDTASQSFVLPSAVNAGNAFWIFLAAPETYAPADL